MTKMTELTVVTTLASGDLIPVVASGVTSAITLANLQKLVGGSGGGSGATAGTTNLLRTSGDLTSQADWFQYDSTNPALTRAAANEIVAPSNGGNHVLYQANTLSQLPVGTYTLGFTATRKAGSGSGKARANVYYEGPGSNVYATDQTVTDGTSYRSSLTFTIPQAASNTHVGVDFTTGGGDFTFSKFTLVTGSTDNPNAT